MGGSDTEIWFDGVDKNLIKVHTRSKDAVIDVSGRDSLMTKAPLLSHKAILRRHNESSTSEDARAEDSKAIFKTDFIRPTTRVTDELALDCEMVECYGHKSVLARVSIVNLFGHPILDSYASPPSTVTDYRTKYSGIRKKDLDHAPSFDVVQAQVSKLIEDKIVVGHAVHNDFGVLKLDHPADKIRDTSEYFGRHYFLGKTPSLKKLSESVLGIKIQQGEHDSVQDAQATMKLYLTVRDKWEETTNKYLMRKVKQRKEKRKPAKKQKQKPKKKKVKTIFTKCS